MGVGACEARTVASSSNIGKEGWRDRWETPSNASSTGERGDGSGAHRRGSRAVITEDTSHERWGHLSEAVE